MTEHLQFAINQLTKLSPQTQDSIADLILMELDEVDFELDTSPPSRRQFGLFPDIWVSDDFDDELPDEFWGWDKP